MADAAQKFNPTQTIPGFILFQRQGGLTAADKQFVQGRLAAVRDVPGVASDQVGPQPTISSTGPKAGEVAAISVPLVGKEGNGASRTGPELVNTEQAVIAAAKKGAPDGLRVLSAGPGGILVAFIDAFSGIEGSLLFAALGVVILILLIVYRSPVLWFFPLFSAVLALGVSSIFVYVLAKGGVVTLNGQTQGILDVLVIGAGTDYALLLISRYREELHEYESRLAAMTAAWKGVAPAIGASGMTVMLGLLCLSFAELNSTAGLGPVCAIGIAATMLVMLTVLPALLVLAGRWIFWPKRPSVDYQVDIAHTHPAWSRYATGVVRHRRRNWIGAAVVLLLCAFGLTQLRTGGLSNVDAFTSDPPAVVGQHLYENAFPQQQGAGAPADILANADTAQQVIAAAKQVDGVSQAPGGVCVATDFQAVATAAKQNPAALQGLGNSCPPDRFQVSPQDGKLLIEATLTSSYDTQQAYDTVGRLRDAVAAVPGADALVGGSTATNVDIQAASRHDRNLIIPLVLLVIMIILGLLLRALVAPVLLILTVVLSFAASLGVSALFFNHVFGFANADPAFPLFAFVFLVALGIDYNIFLMTRVREESLRHGTREGIVRGLAVTGGVITSAGIVLAATFVVLGVLPIVFLAEIGFAVAFGVLLDTIVVRSILVPALSHDLGRTIWWPSALARE